MNLRRFVVVSVLLTVLGWSLVRAAETPATPAPRLSTSSGRAVFWRGEPVGLTWSAPAAAAGAVQLFLTVEGQSATLPVYQAEVKPVRGQACLNVLLPTTGLGDGRYTVTAKGNGATATTTFTLRETTTASPGMVIDESGFGLAPNSKLAGQTGEIAFMLDAFTNPQPGLSVETLNRTFDAFADQQILFWAQDATRPFSFYPPSSSPNTDGEYLRRLMLGCQVYQRYPAFGGQVFDYDPTGFLDFHVGLTTYWGWGNLREELRQYLVAQEAALHANFKKETGLEPPTPAESMALAAALHSPEAMGYIDLPTRRWAYQIAARSPQMDAKQLESLKQRSAAWYGYLMTMNKRRYTGYLTQLRPLDPTLKFSTSNTINHSTPRNGGEHGSSYEPLDFRYVAVWDDQGGNPEHLYETVLAATLLNINRTPNQPLWIDTVQGMLNGNLFRNAMQVAGRGGEGTGYAMEMNANLGANGPLAIRNNSPRNQEYAANAKLMTRFGGLFTSSRPVARVGLLYSMRQGIVTPYAQSYCDGLFKMLYLLSHIGLPPALVTESMLERGLPADMDTLIVLRQSEELPAGAMKPLTEFVARGGRVIADTATTVRWDFLERSAALDLPFRDLGHPYNMMTAFNRGDATIGVMRELVARRCPQLRTLLQASLHHVPLDASQPDVGVATLRGGLASFVTVADDSSLDFSAIFTPEQKLSADYQRIFASHGLGANASWMPINTDLLLSPTLGAEAVVYDLLAGQLVQPKFKGGGRLIPCDLTATPARLYAVYPAAVKGRLAASQTVKAGSPIDLRYEAVTLAGQPLAAVVPVTLSLLGPDGAVRRTIYRATDETGQLNDSLPTGAFENPGTYRLVACQQLDGRTVSLPITLKAGTTPKAEPAPRVAVRDPESLRRFIAGKPEIVIPVFDGDMLPLAKKVADGLTKRGVKARVWEKPSQVNYALAYVVKADEAPNNALVDRGEAIGKVQFANMVNHVNGNFYGSALTGFRYGKNVLLLGVPGKNPVLDAVAAAGLLWTDQSTSSAGSAVVQLLPWALAREADTVAILAADLDGLAAGVDALLNPPAADPVTDGVRAARQRMLQQRAVPLTARMPASKQSLTAKGAVEQPPARESALGDFVLTAVTDVQELGSTLAVALGRYGATVALVDRNNGLKPATIVPSLSPESKLACGKSIVVTMLPGMTFGWAADGKPLWRALAEFKAVLPGTDDVVVENDKKLYRISADGQNAPFAGDLSATNAAPVMFKAEPVTTGTGNQMVAKSVRITDTRSGKEITGLTLTARNVKPAWEAPQFVVVETLLTGGAGNLVLAFHRDIGVDAVQLLDTKTGKAAKVSLATAYLTDAAVSRDDKYAAVAGMEGTVVVVDPGGHEVLKTTVGAFPRLFALTGGGFAVGTADGQLALLDPAQKKTVVRNLMAERTPDAEEIYRQIRGMKLVTWANPPPAAGAIPLEAFYGYLRDDDGQFKMIAQPPAGLLDFRWMDAAQGQVLFPQTKSYTVTIRGAAKYFDQAPQVQPTWTAILAARAQVVKNERPAPSFRLYVDGKAVGTLTPDGGALKPFVTTPPAEGWAKLDPKPEEITTFTTTVDVPAGSHLVGLEPLNMEDCYFKELTIK